MTPQYKTLTDSAEAEIIVRRSRFIAIARRVDSDETAVKEIAAIRKEYYDATHVCYAYVADTDARTIRFSDDGEPSGTAGAPILEALKTRDLRQTLLAVVRYFGGTKLGTGGLKRAYADAAALCLDGAEICEYELCDVYTAEADFSTHRRYSAKISAVSSVLGVEYSDKVNLRLAVAAGDRLADKITELTDGKIKAIFAETRYIKKQ